MDDQEFEYNGERWVHAYIRMTPVISSDENVELMNGAAHMYVNRLEKMTVEGSDWAGELRDTGQEVTFAGVKGHLFNGDIYTFDHGRTAISFVVGKSNYRDPMAHQRGMQRRQNRRFLGYGSN